MTPWGGAGNTPHMDIIARSVCVIPAAGRGSRMSANGREPFKPLLPWKGKGGPTTLCAQVAATARAAGCLPLVVTGYRAAELEASLSGRPGLLFQSHPGWERGMASSALAGARAALDLLPDAGGFLVCPADMPLVPVKAFTAVLDAAGRQEVSSARTVFPAFGGRFGHPVWIPYGFIPLLEHRNLSERLKDALQDLGWTRVDVDDPGILVDMDTPEEYEIAVRDFPSS